MWQWLTMTIICLTRVTAHLLMYNCQHRRSKAHNLAAILSTESNLISFNENSDNAAVINTGGTVTFSFDVDVSEEAVIGENVQFTMTVTADNDYTMNGNFTMPIGLILENFENGDFSQMAWEFSGNQLGLFPLMLMKVSMPLNQVLFLTVKHQRYLLKWILLQMRSLVFGKKYLQKAVMTFLKFYINDQEMGSWSGDDDWSIESYEVSSGATTFSWTYSKDGSVSSGDDAAWIDNIIFNGTPPQPAQLSYSPGEFNCRIEYE